MNIARTTERSTENAFWGGMTTLEASKAITDKDVDTGEGVATKRPKPVYLCAKRICDIAVGLLGCALVIPVAIAVKVSYLRNGDKDPIIYRQARVGKNGKQFWLYKFRTMVPNADKKLAKLLASNASLRNEWEAYQKLEDDPRITPTGKWLRNSSLDETPQFINLLKGDMSLIGPRPLVPGELDAHHGNHLKYESVKPGMSGWWAVNGRSEISFDDRLKLEYYYIDHAGVKIDLACVGKTLHTITRQEGAK